MGLNVYEYILKLRWGISRLNYRDVGGGVIPRLSKRDDSFRDFPMVAGDYEGEWMAICETENRRHAQAGVRKKRHLDKGRRDAEEG